MIVRYASGLGNQLFQYAFGKAVKERFCCSLRFDTTSYFFHRLRKCEIEKLNIRERQRISFSEALIYNCLFHAKRILPGLFFRDMYYVYQNIEEKDVKKYFSGIWQVTAYFDFIRGDLQQEFTVAHLSKDAEELRRSILEEPESVAIHVRRGDYLTVRGFVVQDMDYYGKAIGIMNERLKAPRYYVFSDDMAWCREQFSACNYEVQYVEGYSDVEDFMLMRACRNHIIANSTFSWWPAYLTDGGIKVAPSHWFHREDYNTGNKEGILGGFICV